MATVKQLIEQLEREHEPDEAILFQYLVAEHTSYAPAEFEKLAEIVIDSNTFGDDSTQFFLSALEEAEYEIEEA